MKQATATILCLLCLIASSAVYLQPVKAQSLTNITINADGSVTPSSAPIIRSGNTYILTNNIAGSIEIDRNSITFNGMGHAINETSISSTSIEPFGIELESVTNVTVTNTTVTNVAIGILALDTPTAAIDVEGGGSNKIIGNNVSNNYNGISFFESNNNLIIGNNMTNNRDPYVVACGLIFWSSFNNTVYHNNFINNTSSAGDATIDSGATFSGNTWDDGFPAGGNYWGNQTGKEIDSTGISDTPYTIDSLNKDRYPLTQLFSSSFLVNYEQEVAPPKVSVASPLNQTYSKTSISLTFQIDKIFNWVGYSLDGQTNVTINNNSTISNVAYGSHSITVYANSTFGIIGASKTVDFNVAKSEPFASEIVIAVLIVAAAIVISLVLAAIYRIRHQKAASFKK
jgi:parallel beta-helix repeat protein